MDKRSIFGFVVIGIILIGWLYWQNINSTKEQQKKDLIVKQIKDSLSKVQKTDTVKKEIVKKDSVQSNQEVKKDSAGSHGMLFSKFEKGADRIIRVETDKYYAEFSTKGASIIKY